MYLTKISGRAIKGANFDIDLTPGMVIVGDNFAGKTRITDAIRLLLIGYLPELGKLAKSTFGLASGPVMAVRGEFDNGRTIWRRWFLDGNSVKREEDIPPDIDATTPLLTVMMNAEEYFALSDRERVNYVFANCGAIDITIPKIVQRVKDAAQGYEAFDNIVLQARTNDADEERTPQEFIETIIELVAEDWKRAKDSVKRMEETVKGLTALRAADQRARPLAVAESELRQVELAIADLNQKKTLLGADYNAQHAASLRRSEIARALQSAEIDRTNKSTLTTKLANIIREFDATKAPQISINDAALRVNNARHELDKASKEIEKLAAENIEVDKAIADLFHQTSCPYCRSNGTNWRVELSTHLNQKKARIDKATTEAMEHHRRTREALEATMTTHRATTEVWNRIEGLEQEKANVEGELSKIELRLARVTALEQERDRLPTLDPELTAKVDTINTALKVRQEERQKLDLEIRGALGRQNDLKRLADAETARDAAKARQDHAKTAGTELRAIQAELVKDAFRPMLWMANKLFSTVLLSPIEYRDGEIGTYRDGQWIGHRTMSGTEKLLTYAAIQSALATKSPTRLVILDELGRLTAQNATKVARSMHDAIEGGLIDQFIGIDPERKAIYHDETPQEGKWSFPVLEVE